jgi:DNA-binding transcriptional ArsR family regulator
MELADPFEMTQPAVSRHLKVLEGAGLISRRVDGAKRPCRLDKKGIKAIEQCDRDGTRHGGELCQA